MECPICFRDDLSTTLSVSLPCQHKLCMLCFLSLMSRTCPLCRKNFESHVPTTVRQELKTELLAFVSGLNVEPKQEQEEESNPQSPSSPPSPPPLD